MIYANPGFAHSEYVHMLVAAELFFPLLRLGRYIGDGRVPTLRDTELGLSVLGRNSIQCSHLEKQRHRV
jgi:hypothetical protein